MRAGFVRGRGVRVGRQIPAHGRVGRMMKALARRRDRTVPLGDGRDHRR